MDNYAYVRGSSSNLLKQTINRTQELEQIPFIPSKFGKKIQLKIKNKDVIVYNKQLVYLCNVSEVNDDGTGYIMDFVDDLYSVPYPSHNILIGKYKLSSKFVTVPISCSKKCISIKCDDIFTVIPFANNLYFG